MQRLLAWLSFMPPLENVARSLVLDHLSSFNPIKSMIWHLDKSDSLILLASYGDQETPIGKSFAGSIWRTGSKAAPFALHTVSGDPIIWSEGNTQVVINLYAQNLLIGFLSLSFAEPVGNVEDFNSDAEEFSWQISLYLALRFHGFLGLDDRASMSNGAPLTNTVNKRIELTTRQVSILSRVAAKKTNHEIAKELGYSVSTVRHETMRIFESLGVSDRVTAASEGHRLGLL
ncbi:MAG: LuxR C-terminal-related transcriptional regulator [Actinomycetota bacterium]